MKFEIKHLSVHKILNIIVYRLIFFCFVILEILKERYNCIRDSMSNCILEFLLFSKINFHNSHLTHN
jgi:hypothetical protein